MFPQELHLHARETIQRSPLSEMTLLTADINYCLHLNEPQHSMSVQKLKFIFEINTTVPEALKPDQTCNKLFTTPQFGKSQQFVQFVKSQQFVQFVKLFLIHQHGALLPEKNQDSSNTPERGLLVEGVSSIQDPCEVLQLAAVIRLDHSYSSISVKAWRPKGLEERYLKNAAVLPDICPAVSVWCLCVCQKSPSPSLLQGAEQPGHLQLCGRAHEKDTQWSATSQQPWAGTED